MERKSKCPSLPAVDDRKRSALTKNGPARVDAPGRCVQFEDNGDCAASSRSGLKDPTATKTTLVTGRSGP